MIYTYSVLKGYQAMLGNIVLHTSIAIATLVYVKVPRGFGVKIDESIDLLYMLQIMMHVVSAIVFMLQAYVDIWKHMETASNLCSILVIIVSFQVFMQQFRVMSLLGDQSE